MMRGMEEQQIIDIAKGQDAAASYALARTFINKVYAWMALTLLITAGVAVYSTGHDEMLAWTLQHPLLLCLGTLGIIVAMSLGARAMSPGALAVLLIVFSVAEGMLFGPLLLCYTQQSLGVAFACAAGAFGATSLYGAFTTRNLSVWGRTLFMLLIGLLPCLVINVFWGNGAFDLVLSFFGVILFSALTAYDTQKLLAMGAGVADGTLRSKAAVLGALTLYLDFINIFLFLLRLMGDRR